MTTDTTRDFIIQSVYYYTEYALLYRMCIIIVYTIIQSVHYYTQCALLYKMCIIQDVHYYKECTL